ncbi:ABC transporter substrate-binding protein [Salmonirosea aquatica]|uniref:ABC transporter substrate-binding protein n=1 Tax=Salmonirosea aquatica TaxID=2654236 RepID=A0A7C9F918_9BACT|nr:ABC transporter substrate-binding protein [Cytophagaceae bacterium SJW1-29]
MTRFRNVLFACFALIAVEAQAQLFDQPERKFMEGMSFYRQGKFEAAMREFGDITSSNANDTYAPLAHFYYALSAHMMKRYNESNLMLRQLLTRYATWPQRDEAYYLLANNYFELGDFRRAFDFLNRIGDPSLGKDVQGIKQHFLAGQKDLQVLKSLNSEYPNDRVVALALVQLIQKSSSSKADLELSDRLTNQYGIEVAKPEPTAVDPTATKNPPYEKKWTKGYYNLAVLFPFRLDELKANKRYLPNQYAYDYYSGMQVARQQLKSEGILINIQAYDVGNEEDKILEMVNNVHFRQADLIFGPLYSQTFEMVADYANLNNIALLNPLATDSSILVNGKLVYLAHPSLQTQVRQAVRLAKTKNRLPLAAIYYGHNAKDSSMAFAYRSELIRAGGKVLEIKEIDGSASVLNEQMSNFEKEKPNHVVLFSTDSKAGPSLMNVLAGRQLNGILVIAVANSFDFNRVRPTGYGGNLYLIETDYVDIMKDSVKTFQKDYFDKTNTLPSVYSYQGYDQLLFFGRMIGKYNERMKDGIELRKYVDDYLLSGFDYTKSRENSVSAILEYNDTRWVPWPN